MVRAPCSDADFRAEIAHLAERRTRNAQVPGSIPGLGYFTTAIKTCQSGDI